MTPPATLDESGVLNEVFLSPRVIDRGAFEDYATRLRAIISEATREADRLQESAARGLSLRDEMKSVTIRTGEQAQRAVELVRLLGERVVGLQRSLAEAGALAANLGGFEARLEAAARARLEAFEKRVEQRLEAVAAKAEADALGRLMARLTAARDGAAGGVDRLQRSLEGAVEFTDRLAEQHGTMRREAEMLLAAARDALAPIEEAARVRDGVATDLADLAASIKSIAGRASEAKAAKPVRKKSPGRG